MNECIMHAWMDGAGFLMIVICLFLFMLVLASFTNCCCFLIGLQHSETSAVFIDIYMQYCSTNSLAVHIA